jgi:hypothetical protein
MTREAPMKADEWRRLGEGALMIALLTTFIVFISRSITNKSLRSLLNLPPKT